MAQLAIKGVFLMLTATCPWTKGIFEFSTDSFSGINPSELKNFLPEAEARCNDLLEWKKDKERKGTYQSWNVYTHETIEVINSLIASLLRSFKNYKSNQGTQISFTFLLYSAAGLIKTEDFIRTLKSLVEILQSIATD